MSIIIAKGEQICNSSLNNSVSKMMYSFGKSKKFPIQKRNMFQLFIRCNKFYQLPDLKSIRSSTFGYGNKINLANQNSMIAPNQYLIYGQFDQADKKKKGIIIPSGRQNQYNNFLFPYGIYQTNFPGPNYYNQKRNIKQDSFKIREKLPNPQQKYTNRYVYLVNQTPGPGSYQFQPKQNNLSKYKKVKSYRYSQGKRFETELNNYPSPQKYIIPSTIANDIVYGNLNNSRKIIFGKSGREKNKNCKANLPGPGSYRLPSQFGQYLSKHAKNQ